MKNGNNMLFSWGEKISLLSAIFLFTLNASAETFERAIGHYSSGNYQEAHTIFKELAEFGNCDAMFNIGVMHLKGQFVKKDKALSWAWMKLGDECEPGKAGNIIASLEKKLTVDELNLAQEKFKELTLFYGSEAVYKRSVPNLTDVSSLVVPAKVKFVKPPTYPKKEAQRGVLGTVQSMFAVSEDGLVRYITILSSKYDGFSDAVVEMLYTAKYSPANVEGRNLMSIGEGYRINFTLDGAKLKESKYQEFIANERQKAVEGGADDKLVFAFVLGELQSFTKHLGNDKSKYESPIKWFHEAAVSGSPLAKFTLGVNHLHGRQCEANTDKALYWLMSAAKDGVLDAKFALGYEFLSGHRVPQDIDRGLTLLDEAARKGFNHAALYLTWVLSTSDNKQIRNLEKAQEMSNFMSEGKHGSYRELYETQAALNLLKGDFKEAKSALKRLKKFNKKHDVESKREEGLWKALEAERPYVYKI